MKLYTSYFYQIRFFAPNIVPVSTAVWDPKWYHNFAGQDNVFLDKRGVVNGLRAPALAPGSQLEGSCAGKDGTAGAALTTPLHAPSSGGMQINSTGLTAMTMCTALKTWVVV